MALFAATGSASTSCPATRTAPALGVRNPVTIFIVVDLPAPLGPRKPRTSPLATSKDTPSTALRGPKCFARPRISIIALMEREKGPGTQGTSREPVPGRGNLAGILGDRSP